jgi:hypothetical protein
VTIISKKRFEQKMPKTASNRKTPPLSGVFLFVRIMILTIRRFKHFLPKTPLKSSQELKANSQQLTAQ